MPAYKATVELAPGRFSEVYDDLKCSVCLHVADRAVESLCCNHLFCAGCICLWLQTANTCPLCKFCMQNSYKHRIALSVVYSVKPPSDPAMRFLWVGCQKKMKYQELREHTAICAHNLSVIATPLPNVATDSTTFKEAIAASPSKFKSKTCNTTFAYILKCKAENDKLEAQTGGHP